MVTLSSALDAFLFQKRLDGIGLNSIDNYKRTISFLVCFIGSDVRVSDLSHEQVAGYVLDVLDRPISRATASSYIRNARIFLRWVYEEYGLSFDPTRIKVPKSPKKNVYIYSDEEIVHIFSLIETSVPWITARNRAIIALMLDSGIRQCEVCSLKVSDVDSSRLVMKVTGKGAKDRMVSLGRFSLKLLHEYMALCPYSSSDYVFYDRRGNRLSGNAVRLFVNRLEKKLPFSLSSHRLRHNFATNYCIDHVRQTGNSDVYNLSILMGHESIETTKKYEHFAHEMIAAENGISHLDMCLGNPGKSS